MSFTVEGDEDDDDDENEAGPPGEYEEEDDEDDGASDLGEGEEEEEVGLSYLMKEEIQVRFVNPAKGRKRREAPVGFCGYGEQSWYSSQSREVLVAVNWSHKRQDSSALGPGQVLPSGSAGLSRRRFLVWGLCARLHQQHPSWD